MKKARIVLIIFFVILLSMVVPYAQSKNQTETIEKKGCCSSHGGVCGCDDATGKVKCCDDTLSKSCRCS